MNKTLRNKVVAIWIGIVGFGKPAQADGSNSKPQFAVCVHNYAQVSPAVIDQAEKIAQRIFERAGVRTIWTDAALSIDSTQVIISPCVTSQPLVLVNILSRERAAILGLPGNVLGVAPGTAEDHNRKVVFVFDQVANELVRQQNIADKSLILGHAMAHEIGHILTHIAQHSPAGIMQANWKKADFHDMTIGKLNFDSDQAGRIQAEVIRRSRQQASSELASLQ